jgi:hypothetical protein
VSAEPSLADTLDVTRRARAASECPDNVIVQSQEGDAIAAPDRDRGAGDTAESAVTIRNNCILFKAGVLGTGIVLGTEGKGHVVVSNAIKRGLLRR